MTQKGHGINMPWADYFKNGWRCTSVMTLHDPKGQTHPDIWTEMS